MSIIKTLGVIGAGQMGCGIAHVAALAKYTVILQDASEKQLDDAKISLMKAFKKQDSKGQLKESPELILDRITMTGDVSKFAAADFIIEAAPENEDIKAKIFKTLCPHLRPTTFLASNTSSLSLTRLASYTDRPDRFIGMHFMNPVPLMKLVEVIKGLTTNEETYTLTLNLAKNLRKEVVLSDDRPGFIINRLLMPMINEAIFALQENIGTREHIDKSMKLGAHHPMGPLELADFIGLDTCLSIMKALHTGLGESKYRPCPLLVKYVDAGLLGKKGGQGFYTYEKLRNHKS